MKTKLSMLMHGIDWSGQDVSGYYGSEKLNGCRAFWTGWDLVSRSGRRIAAPHRITARLPHGIPIDGELYAGFHGFQLTSNAARYGKFDDLVRFVAFDAPDIRGDWLERISYVWQLNIECVDIIPVHSMNDAVDAVLQISRNGGEGIMFHAPGCIYNSDRVESLLKIKPYMLRDLAA